MLPLRNPIVCFEKILAGVQEVTFMIFKVLEEVVDSRKINF